MKFSCLLMAVTLLVSAVGAQDIAHVATTAATQPAVKKNPKLTPGVRPATFDNEKVKFDIQGQRIGDTINKEWAYQYVIGGFGLDVKEALQKHLGYVDAPDGSGLVEKDRNTDGNVVGLDHFNFHDQMVIINYHFADRKLAGVSLSFPSSLYDTIEGTYTNKFGQAPQITTEKVTTRAGEEYTNEVATWRTDSGLFVLRKYGSDTGHGAGELTTPEWDKALEKLRAQKKSKEEVDLKQKL